MATGRKSKPRIVKQVLLKKTDVTFDSSGRMVIRNPKVKRLIEQRWLAAGVITPANIICPRPGGPTPPSPDGMCACAYITIGQEVRQGRTVQPGSEQIRTRTLRPQQPRTVQTRGTHRTPEL
jgi:hypothetical protein